MVSPEKGLWSEPPKGKDANLLIIRVGARTIEVPRKKEYTMPDIFSATETNAQTARNRLTEARRKDSTIASTKRLIEVPGLLGRRLTLFFPQDSFIKAVIAIVSVQPTKVNKNYLANEDLVLPDGTKVGGLKAEEKTVLQLFVDKGKEGKAVSGQEVLQTHIVASGNPQIGKRTLHGIIHKLSTILEETDFTIANTRKYNENGRIVRSAYLFRKHRKNNSFMGEETRRRPEVIESKPRREITTKEIGLKATLEILSFWVEGKPEKISKNVRVILGHHLPHKDTIPAIFGSDVTDEELKKFLIESFTSNLQEWWGKNLNAVENTSKEEIQIVSNCKQLSSRGRL